MPLYFWRCRYTTLLFFPSLPVLFSLRSHFIFGIGANSIHVVLCGVSLRMASRMMLFGDNLRRQTHFTSFIRILNGWRYFFFRCSLSVLFARRAWLQWYFRFTDSVLGAFPAGNGYSSFAFSGWYDNNDGNVHGKQFIVVSVNLGGVFCSLSLLFFVFFLFASCHLRRRLVPVNVRPHRSAIVSAEFRRLGRIHTLLPLVRLVTHFSACHTYATVLHVQTCISPMPMANTVNGRMWSKIGKQRQRQASTTYSTSMILLSRTQYRGGAYDLNDLTFPDSRVATACIRVADDHPEHPFSMAQATSTLFCY